MKVVVKCVGDRYCKKMGVMTEVQNKYVATISISKVELDPARHQTVIPAAG
jgi:DNA-binding protein